MNCPSCQGALSAVTYEGIDLESCPGCGGLWLDAEELGKIVRVRERKFDEQERRAIAESTTTTGVALEEVDRDLPCPKCSGSTDAINYGGDSGILLDRCTACRGFWADAGEIEKIQMLVEGWEDLLPEDLAKYGPKLRDIAVEADRADDVSPSRLLIVGPFINAIINGILDLRG